MALLFADVGVYKNITRSGGAKPADSEALPSQQPLPVIEVTATEKAGPDKFEEINKLHELKVKGALTDEEFAAEKKKILDR